MTSIAETRTTFPVVVHMLLQRPNLNGADQSPEILLLRRFQTGFMDGHWSLPGGHVEPGELPAEAAVRECQEETGVKVATPTPLCLLPYRSATRAAVHVGLNLVFVGRQWQHQPYLAEPQQADMLVWAPIATLPKPFTPWLRNVLALLRGGQWYEELSYDTRA